MATSYNTKVVGSNPASATTASAHYASVSLLSFYDILWGTGDADVGNHKGLLVGAWQRGP